MTSTSAPAPSTTRPEQQDPPDGGSAAPGKQSKLDLSLTQILGGALAAMTAAALGSRLGVGGTITGAAVASVIAGVAGSVYTASLRSTHEKVASVLTDRRGGGRGPDASPGNGSSAPPRASSFSASRRPSRSFPWKGVLAAAVATFAVALVALTGLESLAGGALSGGGGTTIEQVTKPHHSTSKQTGDHGDKAKTEQGRDSQAAKPSESATASTKPSAPTQSPTQTLKQFPAQTDKPAPGTSQAPPQDTKPTAPATTTGNGGNSTPAGKP